MDFLGGQCKNCKTRISLAEKDLYNGYCNDCLKYGFVGLDAGYRVEYINDE